MYDSTGLAESKVLLVPYACHEPNKLACAVLSYGFRPICKSVGYEINVGCTRKATCGMSQASMVCKSGGRWCCLMPKSAGSCLHLQSSASSEMSELSFAHMDNFTHRHIPEGGHDFASSEVEFLSMVGKDIAGEASAQAFVTGYLARHPQPPQYAPCSCSKSADPLVPRLRTRGIGRRTMPKHFYVNQEYRSSLDRGNMSLLLKKLSLFIQQCFMLQQSM